MHDSPHPDHELRHPEIGYERSDASMRGVLAFILVLAIVGIFVHLLLWGMYRYLASEARANDPVPNPLVYGQKPQEAPEPRLQKAPVADMNMMRLDEMQRLNSYGWVDKSAGVAHIPIERAMDLVAQRGLPTRAATKAPSSKPAGTSGQTVKK